MGGGEKVQGIYRNFATGKLWVYSLSLSQWLTTLKKLFEKLSMFLK